MPGSLHRCWATSSTACRWGRSWPDLQVTVDLDLAEDERKVLVELGWTVVERGHRQTSVSALEQEEV